MKSIKRTVLVSMILVAAGAPAAAQELRAYNNPDSSSARAEADAWLARVDAGDFAGALERAAPFLGDIAGSPAGFGAFVRAARERFPAGPPRRLAEWQPRYAAQGAPPGAYAALLYDSESGTRETVVIVRTPQGWRVAMYMLGR